MKIFNLASYFENDNVTLNCISRNRFEKKEMVLKWIIKNSHGNFISNHPDSINSYDIWNIWQLFLFYYIWQLGDFNVSVEDRSMKNFCNLSGIKSLTNATTRFKNLNKPSCIDLIQINLLFFSIVLFSRLVFLIFIC